MRKADSKNGIRWKCVCEGVKWQFGR